MNEETKMTDVTGQVQQELEQLYGRLMQKIDADKYRSEHRKDYNPPDCRGYSDIPVLEFLWGLPLCDLVMAYVHALRPNCIRIHTGCVTCDGCQGRVSIRVDKNDIVQHIEQEVEVGYSTGADIGECLRALKDMRQPKVHGKVYESPGGGRMHSFINEEALKRINFT